jgi:hypothetical protein
MFNFSDAQIMREYERLVNSAFTKPYDDLAHDLNSTEEQFANRQVQVLRKGKESLDEARRLNSLLQNRAQPVNNPSSEVFNPDLKSALESMIAMTDAALNISMRARGYSFDDEKTPEEVVRPGTTKFVQDLIRQQQQQKKIPVQKSARSDQERFKDAYHSLMQVLDSIPYFDTEHRAGLEKQIFHYVTMAVSREFINETGKTIGYAAAQEEVNRLKLQATQMGLTRVTKTGTYSGKY